MEAVVLFLSQNFNWPLDGDRLGGLSRVVAHLCYVAQSIIQRTKRTSANTTMQHGTTAELYENST